MLQTTWGLNIGSA